RQVAETFGAPDKELVCRFFCVPASAEDALPLARRMFAAYATVPVYTEFFRWLGWAERIDPMVAAWHDGDRKRALFIFGSRDEQHERLEQFAEAGITTFVLTAICPPDQLPDTIRALAR